MAERKGWELPQRHGDTEVCAVEPLPAEINRITGTIIDCAYAIHSTLGPGLLESVYEACLAHELGKRGLAAKRQIIIPIVYDGLEFDEGFRIDLLVGDAVVVELKAVERLLPVHEAQLLTYLKLTRRRVGLLINFNTPRIKEGIRRFVL
ncbi:MAG TPA: GxxExxY protein [Azospirillum sp.]|nr:GxxExxY protein [Azospirillum sp.]